MADDSMCGIGLATRLLVAFGMLVVCAGSDAAAQPAHLSLNGSGWQLQSGCMVKATGEAISSLNFAAEGWIRAVVPGTVLGSQVEDGLFPEPFFGMNLRQIPGTDYPIGKVFGYLPMSKSSPYRCAWWYRTEFRSPGEAGAYTSLHFDGINYRANIWLNGERIASSDQIAGAFRSYDVDISKHLSGSHGNVLAVEVFAQTEKDLGIDFLDWNPSPADKSMGIWRDVSVATTGPVTIANPAVTTHFLQDDLKEAELSVAVDAVNHADHALVATVAALLGPVRVEQTVKLGAGEARVVRFTAETYPQLRRKAPAVWWPYQYGEPHLEWMEVKASVGQSESDAKRVRFGIREVEAELNDQGVREFKINRRKILIRGAGWAPDLFYREPRERLEQELIRVKEMHLNSIRLEGKLGSDAMFDLADEMGILILAGWQCCDAWQKWDAWTAEDHAIGVASMYSQISRLRGHASVVAWMNGSDEAPSPEVEKEFLAVLRERDWPDAVLSAAADRTSPITGKTGVKMSGPYDYVPPEYWYLDKDKVGGAFGFNMETGPGPAIPSVATIEKTLPKGSWWPMDEQWNYHAALGKFAQYNTFTHAMTATYGKAASLDDYVLKAQMMAYDGERAMFEAYGANKYRRAGATSSPGAVGATGVIQWMLNNAWPSFLWHLYDYDLLAGGGYFGTRKANEPLHIQYRYDDRKVVVVNSTLKAYSDLTATVHVVGLDGRTLYRNEARLRVGADGVAAMDAVPALASTAFLRLDLRDAHGTEVSENFYWVPAQLAEMDWAKSTYVTTPAVRYADMRDLKTMPRAAMTVTAHAEPNDGGARITMRNGTGAVAFFVHLRVVRRGTEDETASALWEDNFVSLLPGETRVVAVRGLPERTGDVEVKLDGWNVDSRTVKIE